MLTSSKESFSATSRLIFAQYLGQMAHSRWHTKLCTTARPGFSCEPLFPSLYRDPGTSQVLSEHLAHGRLDRLVIAYNPVEATVFEIIFFQKKKIIQNQIIQIKTKIICFGVKQMDFWGEKKKHLLFYLESSPVDSRGWQHPRSSRPALPAPAHTPLQRTSPSGGQNGKGREG